MATPVEIASMRRYLYGGSTKSGSLSTDDIASYVDENVNLYLAASQAADGEAMNAASAGDKSVGDLSISYGDGAFWQAQSKKLRLRGVRSARPFSGGISMSGKLTAESDSDWDAPESRRGQFDYDGGSTGRTL